MSEFKEPEILYSGNKQLEQFQKLLNENPKATDLKKNPYANNSIYLPIEYIESKLDEIYFGLWETVNFTSQIIVNEIVGKIELRVFHPIAKVWITKTGAASVMIQQDAYKKDEYGNQVKDEKNRPVKINPRPSDIDLKIKNTLVKDYPHLVTECLKNAAKKLGKTFGRNLNRKTNPEPKSFAGTLSKTVSKEKLKPKSFDMLVQRIMQGETDLLDSTIHMFKLTDEQKSTFLNLEQKKIESHV